MILAAVFVSVSCSGGLSGTDRQTTEPPQSVDVSTSLPRATPLAPTQPTDSIPALSNLPSGSGTPFDSYSMALVYHAEGKNDQGNPYQQDFSFVEDSIKSQRADHFTISGMSALLGLASGDLDIYQLDTSLYLYSAAHNGQNASCLSLTSDSATFNPNAMNPAALMKNITAGKLLESGVVVNGVKTDHYTLKNSELGFGKASPLHGTSSQSGEVWLAQDGGFAIKAAGQAEGTFDTPTEFSGKIMWAFDVTHINQLTDIALPFECSSHQSSQSDLVFPPNATGQSQLGLMTVFSSPDRPADISTFFQKNLPAKGWTIDSVGETPGSVITLQISKAGQKLQIMITGDSTTSSSNVIITPVN